MLSRLDSDKANLWPLFTLHTFYVRHKNQNLVEFTSLAFTTLQSGQTLGSVSGANQLGVCLEPLRDHHYVYTPSSSR